MKVSVVVPTWRRPAELARCLHGLGSQSRPADEVLVVLRTDDTATLARLRSESWGQVPIRAVVVGEAGMAASLNAGLAAATGEAVAVTDDDAVPRPDWLERVVALLGGDPGLGGAGGRDWVHTQSGVLDGAAAAVGIVRWYGRVIGNHHLGGGEAREVELLKGVNMAFRREALEGLRVGEGLRGHATQPHWEIGLSLAVRRAGWRLLYDPAMAVDHYPAVRHDADTRSGRPLTALGNEVYNETYMLLRGLPRRRATLVLLYGIVVGTRQAPGIVAAIELALRGKRQCGAFTAAQRARLAATLAAVAGRR